MIKIYCIIDINGLRYVGSTKFKLYERLSKHRWTKNNKKSGSCSQLDLDNCKIILLEECDENIRYEREQYWLDNTDNINKNNAKGRNKNRKNYQQNYQQNYRKTANPKSRNKNYVKKYNKYMRDYKKSWGGDLRSDNNLLLIDVNIFSS